ncbi:beta-N-acetylhexosaminidase [Humitalea sp. 24SJ18S-53]|uniref:beta-N-acetylhexosaminidase n=1 Tax=Humitalea sp. 24SJ18S-53 TaxID=3422307 RepID=UPI003D6671B0
MPMLDHLEQRAAVVGIAGPSLAREEAALFATHPPVGIILFRRNIQTPAQLLSLTTSIRECIGADASILVDQEGGRVARLRPPLWPAFPPVAAFEGQVAEAAFESAAAMGSVCNAAGIDVVCAPVVDLRVAGAHDVIGDRAFSADPNEVARLGHAVVAGLRHSGCVPVMKHIPGHGRALADSHEALPVVTAATDVLGRDVIPFQSLAGAGVWAMTAHILYPAWDADHCATFSRRIIDEVVRGEIGFDGVLITDDLAMGALAGLADRRAGSALDAGCDLVLHCTGMIAETRSLLVDCPRVTERSAQRIIAARCRGTTGAANWPIGPFARSDDPTARAP